MKRRAVRDEGTQEPRTVVLPATAGIVDMARQPRPRKTRARPRRAPRGPRAPERPRQRATARTSTAHLHPLGTAPRPRTFSPELHHFIRLV